MTEAREAIARIIDPFVFELPEDRGIDSRSEVFAKADAILALLNTSAGEDVIEQAERLIEKQDRDFYFVHDSEIRTILRLLASAGLLRTVSEAAPGWQPIGYCNVYRDLDGDLELGASDPYKSKEEAEFNAVSDPEFADVHGKYLGVAELRLLPPTSANAALEEAARREHDALLAENGRLREALEKYEKCSPTLSAIRKILPLKTSWTVEEIKLRMLGKPCTPKDIYNSLGYLTRTGELRHLGYGSYETPNKQGEKT